MSFRTYPPAMRRGQRRLARPGRARGRRWVALYYQRLDGEVGVLPTPAGPELLVDPDGTEIVDPGGENIVSP